jgi:hypothetical protein
VLSELQARNLAEKLLTSQRLKWFKSTKKWSKNSQLCWKDVMLAWWYVPGMLIATGNDDAAQQVQLS